MPDKSGRGAVILTRSQKFSQSSPTPRTHPDFSPPAPQLLLPSLSISFGPS